MRGPLDLNAQSYPAKWDCLARLTSAYAIQTFREVGLFGRSAERHSLNSVMSTASIGANYRHLIQRWLESLVKCSVLRAEGSSFVADRPLPDPELPALWREADALFADNRPLLDYVRNCASILGAVLRGRESPLETLFPRGTFELAQALYEKSTAMRYINGLAGAAFEALSSATPQGRQLRVLEIGAGTGGTTSSLLPLLSADTARYLFTDVSDVFLTGARRRFGGLGFVDFALFDLDTDFVAQGHAPGSFDVIVSANCVHAVKDLRSALERLRALLSPGGVLILVESTKHLAYFDMTTGLIEGWQHFADELRTDNPLLTPSAWISALAQAGFAEARAWPPEGSLADSIALHIIVARAPGDAAAGGMVASVAAVASAEIMPIARDDGLGSTEWLQRLKQAVPAERTRPHARDGVLDRDARHATGRRVAASATRTPDGSGNGFSYGRTTVQRSQRDAGPAALALVDADVRLSHHRRHREAFAGAHGHSDRSPQRRGRGRGRGTARPSGRCCDERRRYCEASRAAAGCAMKPPLQSVPVSTIETERMTPLKRAFLLLESAQARIASLEAASREPIAVVGLACRVPGGGDDSASFWHLLRNGVDATGPVPSGRWDVDSLYHPDPEMPGRMATRRGGFLSCVDMFDPAFFGITRREAQGMDPQQRLLLEVCWEALEHAGQPPDRLQRTPTGVYIGLAGSDYAYLQLESGDRSLFDAHFASGIAHSIASGRLSYLLGLQGPSLTIDTACSSSLVATHLACQALRAGDCRMALAGGVNLILSPNIYIALSHSRMLAPDGRCKTFDAAADGFARSEGCGMIVLKRLSDAQRDGDNILAVIRGTAVNQDGPSSGLTAPNGPAQEAVIRDALARAGVAPRDVSYLEAHGTGTQLGDPLEVTALGAVFGGDRDAAHPLWLGSVKTNLGHLEAAAGIAGLIKVVLSLQHQQLPPHLHFKTPNPHISWNDFAVRVPTKLTPWDPIGGRRIAGVSSFGFSGTNAHAVLEEAPAASIPARTAFVPLAHVSHLFVLSARDATSLAAVAGRYSEAFAASTDDDLASLCFSAATRAHHPQRATILASSITQLRECLFALSEGHAAEGARIARVTRRDPPRIAFLFPGQGAQYVGMARLLDETQPVFRTALDRCAAVIDSMLPWPLRSVIFDKAIATQVLDETAFTQPALFAVEYALAQLWRSWGVIPDVVVGHSVGEYVAACVAGVMTPEDAARLITERGRLMQSLPAGGAMAAIFASGEAVAAQLSSDTGMVSIGAFNGPT